MLEKFIPKKDKPALPKEALEFQPDAEELELTPLPVSARLTLYIIVAMLLFFFIWSIFAKTDKIIASTGKIVSSGKNINISPLQDAIIRSIDVKLGATIKKGDVLVRLDPTFSTADASRLQKNKTYDLLVLSRMESELTGAPFIPPASATPQDVETQRKLLAGRLEEFSAKLRTVNTKISQYQHDIQALQRQYTQMEKQVSVAQELVGMRQKVYEQGSDSRLSMLEAENHLAQTNVSMEQLKGSLASKRHDLTQLLAEKEGFVEGWRNDIVNQLTTGNKDLQSVEEDLSKAERLKELTILTAPSDAVVLDIANYNPGTVIKSGETMMTLVPLNEPLEAAVYIDPSDIGYIRQGDPAEIKLDTYPFQKYGYLDASLRTIAEDAQVLDTTTGRRFVYEGRLRITSMDHMINMPADFRLVPGMTLSSDIKIGSRTVITYITWPLLRVFGESIREP
ncbi:MAG: HlyD family type I secretion periplasmic adaptor subunit [Solidesulfovibrio sp.]|uniref:HlyD family type I secretion periplasmic adaptor subunit n=1 Tax=Solidesulfovibrio sp. TaxID=2910990 RepID=UPI002B2075F9|nr:HlyD family type I secretion periplasmic adaptor subunit [Solidesulfovibrio sp.]MEA4855541.1 HlyD family type I secretion periplasmic adaptor subunit [Solidesulfovibrio sp.]